VAWNGVPLESAPWTLIEYDPEVAVDGTVIDNVDVPLPPEIAFGLNDVVHPVGSFVTLRSIVPVYPLIDVAVIIDVPVKLVAVCIVTGVADIEKSGVVVGWKFVVSGLPSPVAKSYPIPAGWPFDPVVMSVKSAAYVDG